MMYNSATIKRRPLSRNGKVRLNGSQTCSIYNNSVILSRLATRYQILDKERVLYKSYKRIALKTMGCSMVDAKQGLLI